MGGLFRCKGLDAFVSQCRAGCLPTSLSSSCRARSRGSVRTCPATGAVRSPHAKRIDDALIRTCGIAVKRDGEALNPHPCHFHGLRSMVAPDLAPGKTCPISASFKRDREPPARLWRHWRTLAPLTVRPVSDRVRTPARPCTTLRARSACRRSCARGSGLRAGRVQARPGP